MNLDMWFRDDIANLLKAALEAGQFMRGEGGDFQRGYAAAVIVMATNFHLTADDLRPQGRGECTVTGMDGPYRFDGSTTADGIPRLVKVRR